jgi:hypothetical protein
MDETAVLGFAASLGNKIAAVSEEVEELKETLVNPMLEKGRVDTVADLANIEDPQPGWVYLVGLVSDENKSEYMYTASGTWEYIGSHITVDAEPTQGSNNPVSSGGVYSLDIPGRLKSIAAAEAFDPEATYATGDYMTLDGELFRCDPNGSSPYPNLFNITSATTGVGYQDKVCYYDLEVVENVQTFITSNIAITGGTAYALTIRSNWPQVPQIEAAAFFDENNVEVGSRITFYGIPSYGLGTKNFTAPATAAYIRLCITRAGNYATETELRQASTSTAKFTKTTITAELAEKISTTDYATVSNAGIVKPDGVTITADENGVISATTTTVNSWYGVRDIVRRGLASRFFQVGDLLVSERDGSQITWQIIGIDQDTPVDTQYTHSLTLCTVDCIDELQFDAKEAMFAFDEGLAAGTYHFTVGAQPWFSDDVGKTVQFTLTSDIPAGGQIVFGNAYNATMIGATVSVYASPTATTASETATLSEGTDGTDLGTLSSATSGAMNSVQRGLLGSNNYNESAIRQYLNSDKAAGSVWTPQTKWDRPPSWAASTAGLLYRMDPEFVSVIGKVKKRTAKNTISDGGGYIDSEEKFFLPSRTEVYAGTNNSVDEGGPYRYFSEFSDLSSAGTGADSNRTKYRNNVAKYWWLRSPNTGGASYPFIVSPSGTGSGYVATSSGGVAPACCIV